MATADIISKPERLIAIIIGNNNYSHPSNALTQSVSNANDLSEVLRKMHFDVTTITDATQDKFYEVFKTLSETAMDRNLIFIYFSGHCYQVNGVDYMIPVNDTQMDSDEDVARYGVKLEEILSEFVENAKPLATIVALDCDRSYLLKEDRISKNASRKKGIRKIKLPRTVIIQFACDPDQTANGAATTSRNTIYTTALLRHLAREQVDVENVFKSIEGDVYRESTFKQRPSTVSRLPRAPKIYFHYMFDKPKLRTEDFLTNEPLSNEEKNYLDECKEYCNLTKQPLICIANELIDNNPSSSQAILKLAIDQDWNQFNLQEFLNSFCQKTGLPQECLSVRRIQKGSVVLEADVHEKLGSSDLKLKLKMIYHALTDKAREELAKVKLFFMFLGSVGILKSIQKFRSEIKLNSQFNRLYVQGHDYWEGSLEDGRDRGGNPYFCPIGWKRWSFYVTVNFYEKFKGWSICYHGTKFEYGLAILLSGFKRAKVAQHGSGIYASPSINYVCHPRYAEVKRIQSSSQSNFFQNGKYVQFVLECRVHPSNILGRREETLGASNTPIDPNVNNDNIEWIINHQDKDVVDFHDPSASIVCSGIMVRITDEHPALLPQSQWWFCSHLCNRRNCCVLDIELEALKRLKNSDKSCSIIYE